MKMKRKNKREPRREIETPIGTALFVVLMLGCCLLLAAWFTVPTTG